MSTGYEYETIVASPKNRALALAAMAAARAALTEGLSTVRSDAESEADWETSPIAFHQSFSQSEAAPSAELMAHLGHAAAEAESDGEAFAFLAPLAPLALKAIGSKLLPKVASKIMKVAPKLLNGIRGAAKSLRKQPSTKPLVQALPQVMHQTTAKLAQHAAHGHPISDRIAVQTLSREIVRLLGHPEKAVIVFRRARAADRHFHKSATCSCKH